MTNEHLCILAQKGNADAESELIDHLLPSLKALAAKFETQYSGLQIEADDLLQEESISLLRTVYSFCPEKGYLFQTFASMVSKNMMMDYVRKCASAILGRLLHHSHIVNIVGPSYRTKDVLEKLEESRKRNMMPPKLGNFKFPILGKLILPLLSPLESSITVRILSLIFRGRILSLIFRGRDSTPATGSKSVLLSAASKISHPFYQKQTMPHPAHPAISVSLAKGGSND